MARCKIVVFDIIGNVRFVSGVLKPEEIDYVWNAVVTDALNKIVKEGVYKIESNGREYLIKLDHDLVAVLWYDETS